MEFLNFKGFPLLLRESSAQIKSTTTFGAEAEDEETAHEQPSTSSSSLEVPEEDAGYSIASKASIHPELNGHAAEDAASAQNGVDAALSMNGIAVNITSKKVLFSYI